MPIASEGDVVLAAKVGPAGDAKPLAPLARTRCQCSKVLLSVCVVSFDGIDHGTGFQNHDARLMKVVDRHAQTKALAKIELAF